METHDPSLCNLDVRLLGLMSLSLSAGIGRGLRRPWLTGLLWAGVARTRWSTCIHSTRSTHSPIEACAGDAGLPVVVGGGSGGASRGRGALTSILSVFLRARG